MDKNRKIVLILAVLLLIVSVIGIINNRVLYKDTNNSIQVNNIEEEKEINKEIENEDSNYKEYGERKKETEGEREKRIEKEREEKRKEHAKLLVSKGFKETKEGCYINRRCFIKGDITAITMGTNNLEFDKTVSRKSIGNYSCSKDIEFLNDFYNISISKDIENSMCSVINYFDKDIINSFNIKIPSAKKRIFVFYNSSILEYLISEETNYDSNMLEPNYVDTMVSSTTPIKEENEVKNLLYNIIMKNSKEYFKYYDYPNNRYNSDINICGIDIKEKNNYVLESDYCHGGTSTMNFKIDYDSRELEYDMINIKVNISLFMEMYMDIINKDLDYFKNKLGINCAITDNNREILDNFINNEEKNVRIKVNDKLDISIKQSYYTYIVSYIIN